MIDAKRRAPAGRASEEDGQGLAEYGLMIAFVAAVCIVALTALGAAVLADLGAVVPGF